MDCEQGTRAETDHQTIIANRQACRRNLQCEHRDKRQPLGAPPQFQPRFILSREHKELAVANKIERYHTPD